MGSLMHSDQQRYPRKTVPPRAYQVGSSYIYDDSVVPPMGPDVSPAAKPSLAFPGVELQTSEVCPKNFIIFDQTDDRSRIMFHPGLAHKFNCHGHDFRATYMQDNDGTKDADIESTESSPALQEDADDIDALLSLEKEDEEGDDEEELSTAGTLGSCGSSSPDSCSSHGSKPGKLRRSASNLKSSSNCTNNSHKSERKRQRMKKMMKALKGIVPNGDQMNTVAVLDETVRYLKSLKVEAKKLGVGNLKKQE